MVAVLGLMIAVAPQARAVVNGKNSNTGLPRSPTNTDLTLSSLGPGQGVSGFFANADNPFDPVLDGYPNSATPPAGFTGSDEGFAGIIHATPTNGTGQLSLYCFDLHTNTYINVGYTLGTWDVANVPNVGYVARILSEYYPFVPDQPSQFAGNPTLLAAATQAAIWFFSDRYVLSNTDEPLYSVVAGIVAGIITAGPLPAPAPPSLSVSPPFQSSPSTATPAGPFTVSSSPASSTVTVTATGADMYSDSSATPSSLIPNGTAVPSGTQIWLKSTGTTSAVLQAVATATVPEQNVYLYDGNTPNLDDAQKLVLALPSTLTSTVYANAEYQPVGSLTIQKTIAGPAAGRQGQVTIQAVCGNTPLAPPLIVASGTPAGAPISRTYTGIPAGSICTVTETANGQVAGIVVTTVGNGQQVTVPAGGTATANLTDTYDFIPGSLVVTKLVTGEGALMRGLAVITVVCNGTTLPSYVIPSTTSPADVQPMHYDDIPANATCVISELTAGTNTEVTAAVSATVNGTPVTLPATVTVPSATEVDVNVTNNYSVNPGSLTVTKTIAGTGRATRERSRSRCRVWKTMSKLRCPTSPSTWTPPGPSLRPTTTSLAGRFAR